VASIHVSPAIPLHPIDADWYDARVAEGHFDGERVELIDGLLVERYEHYEPHARGIEFLTRHFAAAANARVRVQLPLAGPRSRPEPDIALVSPDLPGGTRPDTALLIVEVAASSHRIDRVEKASLYARMGVPDYWLVDLATRAVEVRRAPRGDRYTDTDVLVEPATIAPIALEHPPLDLAALFAFALPSP